MALLSEGRCDAQPVVARFENAYGSRRRHDLARRDWRTPQVTINYRAAWVPDDDPERDWEIAASLAVEWIEKQCAEQGASAVLVTNVVDTAWSVPSLANFAERHDHTTPQTRVTRVGCGAGPVLAYVPTPKSLFLAMTLARGSSLCAVEGIQTFPLAGWAREAGAINLLRPNKPPGQEDRSIVEAVQRLVFYGTHAYGTPLDRQQAERIVRGLRDEGLLDAEALPGAVAAHGISPRGVEKLRDLISRVSG